MSYNCKTDTTFQDHYYKLNFIKKSFLSLSSLQTPLVQSKTMGGIYYIDIAWVLNGLIHGQTKDNLWNYKMSKELRNIKWFMNLLG